MTQPTLGDVLKEYEHEYRAYLPKNSFTIIRLDGRAFHTYTKGRDKPFDSNLIWNMGHTAVKLAEEIQGTVTTYTQSDEISVVLSDHGDRTEAWFGGNVQKMVSVAASIATAEFNRLENPTGILFGGKIAHFDARVFTLPNARWVMNYLNWRQRDWRKNSVTMAAGAHFSHKELDGKTTEERIAMLKERDILWPGDYQPAINTGAISTREAYEAEANWQDPAGVSHTETVTRYRWIAQAAPVFDTYAPLRNLLTEKEMLSAKVGKDESV